MDTVALPNRIDTKFVMPAGQLLHALAALRQDYWCSRSTLRYRTDPISIREMTYLFIIAALPVMNSTGASSAIWLQLIAANLAVLVILLFLEKEWGFHYSLQADRVREN
jgi:hypothetical protein